MACFLVPTTEAVITTAIRKGIEIKNGPDAAKKIDEGKLPFTKKLRWLENMLWGGSALLAFEHVWHGEVVPFFPFLTAAADPESAAEMIQEMSTVGVSMAVLVTLVWAGMLGVHSVLTNSKNKEAAKS